MAISNEERLHIQIDLCSIWAKIQNGEYAPDMLDIYTAMLASEDERKFADVVISLLDRLVGQIDKF